MTILRDQPLALDSDSAARFARLAMDCVEREYPNHILHLLASDADVRPPRELTPAFYGCFDWHSAVHGHWLLVRLLRFFPAADWAGEAREQLGRHLTPANIAAEAAYLSARGREGFERPYGLAWLLQLAGELREWNDASTGEWLGPLEQLAIARLSGWLPLLTHPIRSGEHSQTAFALGLALDAARIAVDEEFERLLIERSLSFYRADINAPLAFEPSGHDFLSPTLAEADLLRRILAPEAFARWLGDFLPGLPRDGSADWLQPVVPRDRRDGKLAHLDGLNLSRAWMLEGIAAGLPTDDPRRPVLVHAADAHARAGLSAVTGEHYAGGHWLGTFAVYLTTRRGLGGSDGGALSPQTSIDAASDPDA